MICTYHTHSRWSDGKATIPELVVAAEAQGVDELGLSDHFALDPSGETRPWSIPPGQLGEYVREVQSFTSRSGPRVRLGLEVDWFVDHGSALQDVLDRVPFDYIIGSVHEVDGFGVDGSMTAWSRLSEEQQNDKHERYWVQMRTLAEGGVFDIAAHLDLTKKYGHTPTRDISGAVDAALDAIATADLVVELNTAGWHKPCADGYPSLSLLHQCRERDIPVTISSDAHLPEHLVRDFGRAAERLSSVGYEQVARFAGRERHFEPIAEAIP